MQNLIVIWLLAKESTDVTFCLNVTRYIDLLTPIIDRFSKVRIIIGEMLELRLLPLDPPVNWGDEIPEGLSHFYIEQEREDIARHFNLVGGNFKVRNDKSNTMVSSPYQPGHYTLINKVKKSWSTYINH
ncbi:hypothetical protein DFA_03216 [Cavenderia fasciculata]|uniref:Uncharacterized protein n=1 Tax=Cavenderia fasciculata TaxID=261658 RepID=F4PGY7_CACFS|nr:uncharacterized protein DFA_03216 [Cavenderia fasciculata]EGG24971.1 hypothetical protein DFA_03216 [Cavenderia fasciculata]|eukprot:XP_004362822.1 hypothetical protein DFA_03216 [Cavenderia fasciculata]